MKSKDEVLLNLKRVITKLNDGLFWASTDSTRKYKYSEIVEIKDVLVQAYHYINQENPDNNTLARIETKSYQSSDKFQKNTLSEIEKEGSKLS